MLNNFTKTYAFPQEEIKYQRTTMVRHNGTVIAFAMDSEQRIWYTVLDLEDSTVQSPLDFNYWLKNPKPLIFPRELAHVGYGAVTNTTMPDPAPDKREKDKTDEEKFLATTGRLTAAAEFQVLSDGQYVYVFRQAIDANNDRRVWADKAKTKPVVDSTLLVDRFVFVGATLNPKMEVRYQRSRHRSTPQSRKDSLDSKDLNGTFFFEPTHELGIVRGLTDGQFTVLLLPTSVPNLRRWQIFSYNAKTQMIDSFNIERSADGLFNTRGSQFYTCVDHKEVFESQSGSCSVCEKELLPQMTREGFAETAFRFDGQTKVNCGPGPAITGAQARTIEAWIRTTDIAELSGGGVFQYGDSSMDRGMIALSFGTQGHVVQLGGDSWHEVDLPGSGSGWHHICLVYDGTQVAFYYDGLLVLGVPVLSDGQAVSLETASSDFVIGDSETGHFEGDIDEFRVWNYARSAEDIQHERHQRLIGNEAGLVAYWRFDEGAGNKAFDQTDNANHGEIIGNAQWIDSDAPVGDNPGVRCSSFKVDGRSITSGLSTALYFQQEEQTVGYEQTAKPMKKAARVMLAFATHDGTGDKNEVATLDFGVSRDGRLALLRDVVELSTIHTTRNGLTYTETLDEIRRLEREIIDEKSAAIAAARDELDAKRKELDKWTEEKRRAGLKVSFYNDWFSGGSKSIGLGRVPNIDEKWPRWNDIMSSVKVPQGLKVYLYDHWNYNRNDIGRHLVLTSSVRDLNHPYYDFNDRTTSFIVQTLEGNEDANIINQKYREANAAFQDLRDRTLAGRQIPDELAARLANNEKRVRELKEAVRGDVAVPAPVIYTDRFGLTVSGAVLGFAYASHTPLLFDSANGKLGLYFRGENGQFFAAYYDTMTQKADYALTANTGTMSFVARSDDPEMDKAEIGVVPAAGDDTCTLALSGKGVKETWSDLPRDPALLARIVNGNASPLPEDPFYYDYNQVEVQPADINTAFGSTLFRAFPGNATGTVVDQVRSQRAETRVNRWVADSQGNALGFDGKASSVSGTEHTERFGANDDLTLEAWVKPQKTAGNHSQIIHHHSDVSNYLLSLRRQANNDQFSVVTGVGEQFIETEAHFPYEQWTHLAIVHQQSFGLHLDGLNDFLETQSSESLNIDGDLTVELFFRPEALGKPQGLLSKGRLRDGSDQQVPYALHLEADGTIVFTFEQKDGGVQQVRSNKLVSAGRFYRLAVTRKQGSEQDEKKSEMKVGEKTVEFMKTEFIQWEEIRLYLDGAQVGHQTSESMNTGRSNQPLTVGQIVDKNGEANYFNGKIGELRIWNSARSASEIGGQIQGDEQSLVAWWRFEENEEYVALDSKGSDHLNLTGATWTKSPDPRASTLKIYVNGIFQPPTKSKPDALPNGDSQFTLGAVLQDGAAKDHLLGLLEETRIWQSARTQEQIQDNQFRRLIGEWRDLIAYYQFDAEEATSLNDHSGNGRDLTIDACEYRLSDAPVAFETPQVRNALAGVETDFHELIGGRPAVQEYGDLQLDGEGELMGSMKRCYAYIQEGEWRLITGYKIGNLITEWVGQAQFAPQLIGFIEGAPPVPSENLTAGPVNPSEDGYADATSLEVVEAENVHYSYSSAKESAINAAFGMSAGVGGNMEGSIMHIAAPMGVGVGVSGPDLVDFDFEAALNAKVEGSYSWSDEKSVGSSRNLTRSMSVSLSGNWEDPENVRNPAMGRRYQPANQGFALVKSETADIFALRLAHNNALVAYRMRPNPDIPKDWNIIPFPINPQYTKQGTLDGTIGYNKEGKVLDEDYPNAQGYGEYSYFKPREAYTLKRRIDKETEEERTYFANFSASPLDQKGMAAGAAVGAGAGLLAGLGGGGTSVAAGIGAIAGGLAQGGKLPENFAKRNLVNTYVWTADGGFFAESTEISEVQQETTGGTFSIVGSAGGSISSSTDFLGPSISYEMEASLGGSLNVTKTKSKEAERAFSLNVAVDVPGDLQEYDEERTRVYDDDNKAKIVPGKVDAYRFLTFYLEPSTNNFDVFENQVVDRKWLDEDTGANAAALRDAVNAGNKAQKETEKSLPWRVFNRVTFVSRILPPIDDEVPPPTETDMLLRKLNIDSNYELIKRLEPFVRDKTDDYAAFAQAVRTAIANHIPKLTPAADDIIHYMSLYFQVFQE